MDSDATKNKYRKNAVSTNTKANIVMVDNGEDRISKLPDDILNHILSSLPTKDAVGTSVLSKRWNGLWTFINNLDFDDGMLFSHKNATATEKQHFVNFVNRVLHRLSSSTSIHDVTLRLTTLKDECPQHHINAWISTFLRKGVQKLCIKYHQKAPVDFCALFHSISLVELEMKMLWTVTRVPSNSCLRNLQILNISYTMIVGDNIQSKEMVFNFPLLKVFRADHCIWLDTEKVILNTPMLESFSMTCYSFLKNSQRSPWSYEPWSTTINILAPHLRKFLYKGPLSEEIILSDPLSILHVFLEIYHMKNRHAMCQPVVKECMPLKEFHSVETLQLGYFLVMMLCHPNDQLSVLPLFSQLVCLMLDLGSSSQFPEVLLNLLHKSPILQRLVLFCALPEFDRELLTSELPPLCLVSSLKIIEIKSGSWSGGNVFLVKYMLEKARVLEKLTINLCMQDRVSVKNVTDEVLSFPKASKNISIKVERTPWKKINGREINV